MDIPKTPKGLQRPGAAFWRKINGERVLKDSDQFEKLHIACRSLDDEAAAAEIVKAEGRYIKDRFDQVREHPGLKTMRDSRVLVLRALRELGLDVEGEIESRPKRLHGRE